MGDTRDEITDPLDEGRGVAAVSMGWLRECYDADWGRLSTARAAKISAWLTQRDIRHLPSPLPSRETAEVMLFKPDSPIGVYINAARLEGPFTNRPAGAVDLLSALADRL
ncbi:hypothetical protein GCM10010302_11900 [Streptomyces polychromogenes]|uniref:Uncharacterized protein n=1 Tax=Streptomyces polychromogenes TaxID=67342 RepID=A0ABN0V520_9ACTN